MVPGEKSELERLIEQQRADDVVIVWPERAALSLDADVGGTALWDLVGLDEDGELISPIRESAFVTKSGKPIPHGTLDGYNNHGCRCDECKLVMRGWHMIRREAKKLKLSPTMKKALQVALKQYMAIRAVGPRVAPPRPGAFVPKRYYLSIPSPYWPEAERRWKEYVPPSWAPFLMWQKFERLKRNAPGEVGASGG